MKYIKYMRWFLIILTNLFFIVSILKATFIDETSDTNGIFTLIMIIFIILYNFYLLYLRYVRSLIIKDKYLELFMTLLTSIPSILILYLIY